MKDLFIIPQTENSIIAKVENNKVIHVNYIDVPYDSKSVITENNLIVSLCYELGVLKVFDINGSFLSELKLAIKYMAIACKRNTVYLGSRDRGENLFEHIEMFILIDFNNTNLKVNEFTMPKKEENYFSIADILIRNNELIMLDNNDIPPKFIKYFDITNPNEPIYKKTLEIPIDGPRNRIIKGDVNNDWLIINSSTMSGYSGSHQYITISGKKEGTLSTHNNIPQGMTSGWLSFFNYKKKRISDTVRFVDFCLSDDFLYIVRLDEFIGASKSQRISLVRINLNQRISHNNCIPIPTKLKFFMGIMSTPTGNIIIVYKNEYELIN